MTKQSQKSLSTIKICKKCVLPETFPGIKFNKEGICNFCLDYARSGLIHQTKRKKQQYRKKFEELIREFKGKGTYDGLMSYSGGKDSTYTIALMREDYGLNLLAVTMDNGFLPEQTFKNIRNVTEKLGVDHIFFKPRFDICKKIIVQCSKKNIYPPKTLTRASTICTSCMAIVKFCVLRLALEKNIPFIIFGWSPGQIPIASSIMKNNAPMIKVMQKAVFDPLYNLIGDALKSYFLEEKYFDGTYNFPYNLSPLAFLDYDEENIAKTVSKLGWKAPKGVDANSTNCLLNSFANIVHKEKYGFHPYAFELAKLVREGYLGRSAALQKINQFENNKTVESVKKKLGFCGKRILA